MKFDSLPFAWDLRFLLSFVWPPNIIFQRLFRLLNEPIYQFCTNGCNGMYVQGLHYSRDLHTLTRGLQ